MSKFKCFIQHDSMQCGIASLSMVCNHFGLRYPMERIAELCPATTEGVSLQGLSETAKTLGL